MDRFTKEDVRTLISDGDGLKLSIFMPTHRVAADAPQDRIVLKNLRREAAQELERNGLRKPDVREFLSPLDGLDAPHRLLALPGRWTGLIPVR